MSDRVILPPRRNAHEYFPQQPSISHDASYTYAIVIECCYTPSLSIPSEIIIIAYASHDLLIRIRRKYKTRHRLHHQSL